MTHERQPQEPTARPEAIARAAEAMVQYLGERRRYERRDARWRRMKRWFFASLALVGAGIYLATLMPFNARDLAGPLAGRTVAVIPLNGTMGAGLPAGADTVVPMLEKACRNAKVAAVIISINSGGGSPVEADRIGAAIDRCPKLAGSVKPVHALIGAIGASAAYLVALHADSISASPYSLVGSVGAIMRQLDASAASQRLGINERTVASGSLKGGMSLLTPPEAEDLALATELVDSIGERFLGEALASRSERLKLPREELFSGRVWTGEQALALGLVDEHAVLEDFKTRYQGLEFDLYRSRPNLAEALGLKASLAEILTSLATPRVE